MKMLKKLALVSAISAISAVSVGAFAMEAMDDETMSATTGQDGITINIVPDAISRTTATGMGVTTTTLDAISPSAPLYKGLSIGEIRVHDDDGLGVLGTDATANSGALVIGGGLGTVTATQDRTVIIAKGDKPIQINIDMVGDSDGAGSAGGAMLNVEIKQPALAIKLGNIYVANSNAAEAGWNENGTVNLAGAEVDGTTVSDKVKILSGLEIVMNESTMTIQLGNEAQGGMIKADAVLAGGLTINNFELFDESGAAALTADSLITGDVGSGGSIRAKSIKITDNLGTDLTTKTMIDVGSRISASTVTVAGKDTFVNAKSGGAVANYATATALAGTLPAATTALATARDTDANTLFGTTYALLSPAQQTTVNTTGATTPAALTAYTGAATGAGLVAAADYAATLAAATAATAGTWGGRDTYNGLVITSELGGATGADIAINNVALGDTNASVLGDVQILGLMLGKSKIVIMGH